MVTENYSKTAERLWEKFEFHKDKMVTSHVDFKQPFPVDQLSKRNPIVMSLVREVEDEFKYEMSEFQCSWATVALICWDMKEYNANNGTELVARG